MARSVFHTEEMAVEYAKLIGKQADGVGVEHDYDDAELAFQRSQEQITDADEENMDYESLRLMYEANMNARGVLFIMAFRDHKTGRRD